VGGCEEDVATNNLAKTHRRGWLAVVRPGDGSAKRREKLRFTSSVRGRGRTSWGGAAEDPGAASGGAARVEVEQSDDAAQAHARWQWQALRA
jgi:hypothetical protein